MTVGHLTL